ncbi:GNAT family N-acetyltransferase [Lichenihabitans sp. Uapishka_5]|uniref:GNAT family N-acetyltransferase n=1 Tax=Lichenihabitans sp. Uapishka_5 TaxID=3037302 RepID=UPI0029E7E02F|nr:GNAT family N-acetyltransferase [Lichenihabitans sp. Uapishka_5]MDX7953532.1 GNAT family N-acetyltransferase [Lichenihabitans sp. Uapishka_5]
MRDVEALGTAAGFDLVRWRDPELPEGLQVLIAEAVASGVGWIADFPQVWHARPFLQAGEALFLARASGRPVAMAVISADPYAVAPLTGRLRYIYVGAEARSRGLLRVFVDAALDRAGSHWHRLRLHTDNPVAARLYESYGFRPSAYEDRSTHFLDLPRIFATEQERSINC